MVVEKKVYKAKANTNKVITFEIEGKSFKFKPPKVSKLLLKLYSTEDGNENTLHFLNWLYAGLAEKDVEFLKARIDDFNDDLDPDLLIELAAEFVKQVSGIEDTPEE